MVVFVNMQVELWLEGKKGGSGGEGMCMQHSEQYQVWQNAFVTLRRDSRDAAWACPEELNIEWGEEKECSGTCLLAAGTCLLAAHVLAHLGTHAFAPHAQLLCSFLQVDWGSESTTTSTSDLPSGDASDGSEGAATDGEADGTDEEQQHKAKPGRRSRQQQQQGEGQQRGKRRAVGQGRKATSAPVPAFELPGQAGVARQSGRSRQLPARLR